MNKLVSIITPNYNSEKFISQTINSVLNQTYQNWEMIIVDDVSTDNSTKIIESYSLKDDRIILHKLQKNSGAAIARNKAISLAKGNFIAFLDSDDLWLPKKLEVQLEFMETNNYPISYSSYEIIDENGKPKNKIIECKEKLDYNRMLYSNEIGCLTAMYNSDVLGKVYMPNVRKRQDYGLWLKILKMEKYAFGIPKVLAKYRDRSLSISNNKVEMLKWNWNLYKNVEKKSYFEAFYYTLCNVINKLLK
ncbi:glycosyltransferase family 2 protein [Polaribacter sargassicola]|uniref:glycosyltransferase family 2 protein n=1 Tax=Polaribacter sargassicola TaxID=2836891 RepID=UPI001F3846EF|nr:glycosyltransferase family 2 protein [Polaribacter sp. DS7-9]MCG1036618.1 glycosyltransferase family 2 protein [Polaribacter sp. DS7-9]